MAEPIIALYVFAMEDYRFVNTPLIEARRTYFADPIGNTGPRCTLSSAEPGVTIRYQFRSGGFRWSVRRSGKEQQCAVREKDGYSVHVSAADGSLFRVDYFNTAHLLQRVVYYTGRELRGEVLVQPDGTLALSVLVPEENIYHQSVLVPCPFIPYGAGEAYRQYIRALGVPPVIAYTPGGVVCYYSTEAAADAQKIADLAACVEPQTQETVPNEEKPGMEVDMPVVDAEEETMHNNKWYYDDGKIQNGNPVSHTDSDDADSQLPTAGEMYRELYDSLLQPAPSNDSMESISAELDEKEPIRDSVKEGFGFAHITEDTYYVGQWASDLPNGQGVLMNTDGTVQYRGQWCGGKRCGIGTEYQDGRICYEGHWNQDRYNGNGVLMLRNGGRIDADFVQGEPSGEVREYDANGQIVYIGEWKNGTRNGNGRLIRSDGTALEGTFSDGALIGTVQEYDVNGVLCYRGAYENGCRSGSGMLYDGEQLIYDGAFANGMYHGRGKCYANGELVYAGELRDGKRCGIGASLQNGQPSYFGEWRDGLPNGCGILYENGEPRYAGNFVDGKRHGRVNRYQNEQLVRELICRSGVDEYMVEYENGHPVYAGAVYEGQRSGVGRVLNEYCECEQQGVFKDGAFVRAAQVIPRRLDALQCPEHLRGTPYEEVIHTPVQYVLGLPWAEGIYSGATVAQKPHGKGTLAYADHIYSGNFADGKPHGEGRLYLCSGEMVTGIFGEAPDSETIQCGNICYTVHRT